MRGRISLSGVSCVLLACGSDALLQSDTSGSSAADAGSVVAVKHASDASTKRVDASSSAFIGHEDDGGPACTGLSCQQAACANGGSTTISGTIYDPAGRNPLYNVVAYVPSEELAPLGSGASCDTCASLYSGKPVATALSGADGKFVIKDAPAGDNIPLVVQVGKWRRKTTLAHVTACQDNPQADKSLRLPKNRSEGDLPKIAISTGAADTLECLLRRIGVDASEYTPGAAGDGRIHIFQGGGANASVCVPLLGCQSVSVPNTSPPAPKASQALWNSTESLSKYDLVLLSCEGEETENMNQQALHDYASAGGRVFASHFHYSWFNSGPYADENIATWTPGSNSIGDIQASIVTKLPSGAPFVKGEALKEWLSNTNALTNGLLEIADAHQNAAIDVGQTAAQSWIVGEPGQKGTGAVEYLSFNTPVENNPPADGPSQVCGRVVYSDLHVGAASGDAPQKPVPTSCVNAPLSPQEKALEFMLFDLSSCVTPETVPPVPPVPIVI